jgi:hypothetical protein
MVSFFLWILWVGGLIPAYRHARKNDFSIVGSLIQAISWPGDVGWILADRYCRNHKE